MKGKVTTEMSGLMHHNVHVFSCLYIVARTLQNFLPCQTHPVQSQSSPAEQNKNSQTHITSPPA
jgi:hypothetical protein